jgi:hypothetical protein
MIFINVDLPAPLAPTKAMNFALPEFEFTFLRNRHRAKRFVDSFHFQHVLFHIPPLVYLLLAGDPAEAMEPGEEKIVLSRWQVLLFTVGRFNQPGGSINVVDLLSQASRIFIASTLSAGTAT